jgi:hypothetical protein
VQFFHRDCLAACRTSRIKKSQATNTLPLQDDIASMINQ